MPGKKEVFVPLTMVNIGLKLFIENVIRGLERFGATKSVISSFETRSYECLTTVRQFLQGGMGDKPKTLEVLNKCIFSTQRVMEITIATKRLLEDASEEDPACSLVEEHLQAWLETLESLKTQVEAMSK